MRQRYVVGFLFWRDNVLFIRKARPAWQRGKLNGIGGKVEKGETALATMIREFSEETGKPWQEWEHIAFWEGPDFEVTFFRGRATDYFPVKGDPEEPVAWYPLGKLTQLETLPNTQWLIPLALYANPGDFPYLIREQIPTQVDDGQQSMPPRQEVTPDGQYIPDDRTPTDTEAPSPRLRRK